MLLSAHLWCWSDIPEKNIIQFAFNEAFCGLRFMYRVKQSSNYVTEKEYKEWDRGRGKQEEGKWMHGRAFGGFLSLIPQ